MRISWLLVAASFLLPLVPGQAATYEVRNGDTWASIAWRTGVPASRLQALNGLSGSQPPAGRSLRLTAEPAEPPPATPVPVARPTPPVARAIPTPPPAPALPPREVKAPPGRARAPAASQGQPLRHRLEEAITAVRSETNRYAGRWTPPGEPVAWVMDCSNTARYLLRAAAGLELPRTASDQYELVRSRGKLRRLGGGLFAGRREEGWLRKRLRPGDLLFWEHTYRPERHHPVTHVMVYLGPDARGRLLMAGSQSSRGPDIYRLDPAQSYGGYGGLAGLFRREGRLIAFGRLPGVGK